MSSPINNQYQCNAKRNRNDMHGQKPMDQNDAGKPDTTLRLASEDDLEVILQILRDGKALQRAQGFIQWTDEFPDPAEIRQDLHHQKGWMFLVDQKPAGYVYIDTDEPAYTQPSAAWTTDDLYIVLHRVALSQAYAGKGLGRLFLQTCEQWACQHGIPALRIDTMKANTRMQHLLTSRGWSECGYVQYPFGHRLVFEKKVLPADLSI